MSYHTYGTDYHEQRTEEERSFLIFLKIYRILHDAIGNGKNYDIMKTKKHIYEGVPLNLASIAEIGGKYTSHRSEIISYRLIALCGAAFLYLIIHQIRSHK